LSIPVSRAYDKSGPEIILIPRALIARLVAVLISGTLGLAPFSCCCAEMDAQQLEAHARTAMAMEGVPHDLAPVAHQAPAGDHLCPHKLTASLDAGKTLKAPFIAHTPVPVAYHVASTAEVPIANLAAQWSPRIKPPPIFRPTLVSQHILLLA
jgi:hypothetical protein